MAAAWRRVAVACTAVPPSAISSVGRTIRKAPLPSLNCQMNHGATIRSMISSSKLSFEEGRAAEIKEDITTSNNESVVDWREAVRVSSRLKPQSFASTNSRTFAIISIGGKQYKITAGDRVTVHKLDAEVGSHIRLQKVLLTGSRDWTILGTPTIPGDTHVKATVQAHFKGEKIHAYKKKRRKGYARKVGHRQDYTSLIINEIVCPVP
eukprot:m.100546 g.100546  ORF g.100546 m.100546 type:complete len:208 (+) comp13712_c2_seq1:20-643(+)